MSTRGLWMCSAACLLALGCGDDGGGSGTISASGTGTTPGTTDAMTVTTATSTAGATEGGVTEGTGTASATGTTVPTSTTASSETGTSATATSSPMTSGPGSTTEPVMTSAADSTSAGGSTTDLPPGVCGDGVVNPGEACDDGPNNGPDQNCHADCTANECGDGVQAPEEECDIGADNGPDNGCSLDCKILPSACGNQTAMAEIVPLPVDIIFFIDNSGSMSNEIQGVQSNINNNFAQIIDMSGIDYRVIMVSAFGAYTSQKICVEAPLGGIPVNGCKTPPAKPVNTAKFFHYSYSIASTDTWCKLHGSFKGTLKDQFNLAPMGWQTWLRPDSFKIFVEITDDRVNCNANGYSYADLNTVQGGVTAATKFDNDIRATSPMHFGTAPDKRNYNWYSLVGLAANVPPETPYTAKDPIITGKCPTAVNGGIGYQTLSNMTDALRFPLCDTTKYDAVFQAIAQGVVSNTKISCEFTIPPAPMGKTLDPDSIVVNFTPTGQMNPVEFKQVPDANMCTPMSFYVQNGKVILCPEACAAVQGDKTGKVEVKFSCEPIMPN